MKQEPAQYAYDIVDRLETLGGEGAAQEFDQALGTIMDEYDFEEVLSIIATILRINQTVEPKYVFADKNNNWHKFCRRYDPVKRVDDKKIVSYDRP